jgi:hypothetical protein
VATPHGAHGAHAQSRARAERGPGQDPARTQHPSTREQTAPPLERLLKQRRVIPELCVPVRITIFHM